MGCRHAVAAGVIRQAALPIIGTLGAWLFHAPVWAAEAFSSGVSAGDVTDGSAILWTRADQSGSVRMELAGDADFTTLICSIDAEATSETDGTIKLEIGDLSPATDYWYRFVRQADPTAVSTTGHFRTAPLAGTPAGVRLIFTGDSNAAWMPLTTAGHAARENADLFIWFGDTIYGDIPAGDLGVASDLPGYRDKYRQIRADPYIRELLASLSTWTGWDDHEVRNDYAGLDPDLPPARKEAAYQAFFEYMPIRPQGQPDDPFRTYRRFRYGANIEFFILDARQYREPSAAGICGGNPDPYGFLLAGFSRDFACQEALDRPRDMLGPEQLEWLKTGLAGSTARVKFVTNNVPFTHLALFPYDRWDGYDSQRRDLLEFIDGRQITGVVFLTSDTHANAYNPDLGAHFRHHRPDYRLDNGTLMKEIIAGPLGTETMHDELLTFGSGALGLPEGPLTRFLLEWQERQLVARLRDLNGLAFIEEDRMAYAVIDVGDDGEWKVQYRGLRPSEARNPESRIETLFDSAEPPTVSALPCCWPVLMVLGGMFLAARHR